MALNWGKQNKEHSATVKVPERVCPRCNMMRPESPRWEPRKPCSVCAAKRRANNVR